MWMTTMAQNIPNDIIVEILVRLPADSLIRLRWTCKYWFNLITKDPNFIKMHLLCRPTTNLCVLFKDVNGDLFKRYFNYPTYNASPKVRLDFPFGSARNDFTLFSSCNGLIFFQSLGGGLCIWNTCTKEYIVLPDPLPFIKSSGRGKEEIITYGFGYDRTINDYKVIRNIYIRNEDESNVQVYTLGTNSWRNIGSIPDNICPSRLKDVGMFINGALYWLVKESGVIISFDIEKEKYKVIPKQPVVFKWTTDNRYVPIVVGRQSDLGLFDRKMKITEILNICLGCDVQEVYTESLVSLNSGTYAVKADRKKEMQLVQSSLAHDSYFVPIFQTSHAKADRIQPKRKSYYKILYYKGGKYTGIGDGQPKVDSKRQRKWK